MRRFVYLVMLAATLVPAATASAETTAEKQLAQQIGSHLKQSGQLHNYRVGVRFHDGVAYLNGSVCSPEQRDLAVKLAQQVEGVSHVVSKLDCPTESSTAASTAAARANGDRKELSEELNRASFEGEQNDASNVMQAYEQGGAAPQQPQQQQQFQQQFQPQQMPPQMAQQQMAQQRMAAAPARRGNMPVPYRALPGAMPMRPQGNIQQVSCPCNSGGGGGMGPMGGPGGMDGGAPMGFVPQGSGRGPGYDNPQMPGYAWPSYAAYPNYAALSYPQQYSPTAWPYIGPFYPYPQVPLAWRKVSLEWDDGWWFLDFSSHNSSH